MRDEAALEEMLEQEDYVPQVARYLAAAERLLGARPRAALCLLNVGGTVRLVEDRWGWGVSGAAHHTYRLNKQSRPQAIWAIPWRLTSCI